MTWITVLQIIAFLLLPWLALAKTDTSHVSGQTTSTTTTATDISNAYSATIYVGIVQVGTASSAATAKVELSTDGTNYYDYVTLTAGTAAATYEWVVELPADAQYVRIVFTQQSGGTSSTLNARVGEVTGL